MDQKEKGERRTDSRSLSPVRMLQTFISGSERQPRLIKRQIEHEADEADEAAREAMAPEVDIRLRAFINPYRHPVLLTLR